ncbi:hybrid sensor histidine kinase/response regulator [Desulfovulcanus sp.]
MIDTHAAMTQQEWRLPVSPLTLLNSLPDAIIATDSQMRISYISKAAEEITGFKRRIAIGMYCSDVLKSDLCHHQCAVKRALASGQNIFNIETVITTANNERIPILISAGLLHDHSNNIVGHLCVFRDISRIKKMMEELERSQNELAERNRTLDNALEKLRSTQKQLLQAQKMESIGILAGGVAHDFNNILSGILGYASLIKGQISPDHPLSYYVNVIEQSALRATKLTRQLLIFSRQGNPKKKLCQINKVIEDTLLIARHTIDKRIEIRTNLAPNLPYANADESQIEQVILNLCINASDAIEDYGTLTITTERAVLDQEKDGRREYIKISVSDTGCGIPVEIQHQIFDPFFTTKPKEKGTGLGLSTVYGIIKDHDGHIDFETEIGKGTTFHVYLPATHNTPLSLQKTKMEEESFQGGTQKGTETILLADDEEIIRDLVRTLLTEHGYEVIVAQDGAEALEIYKAKQTSIDLVMLDLAMPRMNGIETLEAIKAINPKVKVIISSGYYADTALLRSLKRLDLNTNSFLNKPYKVEDLLAAIKRNLKKND